MRKETQNETLNDMIISYEMKCQHDLENFKTLFHDACNAFNPTTNIKDTIEDFSQSIDFKNKINKLNITIPSGNTIKSILFGKSKNPSKNLSSLESKSKNLVAKFLNKINFSAHKLFQHFFPKETKSEKLFSESEIYD